MHELRSVSSANPKKPEYLDIPHRPRIIQTTLDKTQLLPTYLRNVVEDRSFPKPYITLVWHHLKIYMTIRILKKLKVVPTYEWTHVQPGRVETLGGYDTCFNGKDQKTNMLKTLTNHQDPSGDSSRMCQPWTDQTIFGRPKSKVPHTQRIVNELVTDKPSISEYIHLPYFPVQHRCPHL